ncbi:MAG: YihY/virulence factor BrkB family protein [Elusimicrobiales bacterium]|jgi:YihY family inner membrane protein|nr:YihY/virulence factor BrkB family protein [Elusimicrobiales bacterium]
MRENPAIKIWRALRGAMDTFIRIDGSQRGAAVAFHAFFSLFPGIVLLVAGASMFLDYDLAVAKVIGYAETFASLGPQLRRWVADTITGLAEARAGVGAVSLLLLFWMSSRAFSAMAEAINLACGDGRTGWLRDNLKGLLLFFLISALVLAGLAAGAAANLAKAWGLDLGILPGALYNLFFVFLPWAVIFAGLALFYKFAPAGKKRFRDVWGPALAATAVLRATEWLFSVYTGYAAGRSVYGVLGGIMALLLWVYISACVVIYCACLCPAGAAKRPAGGVSRA